MELELSDDQYEKIGRGSVAEWQKSCHPNVKSAYIAAARAAVDAVLAEVLPIVLEEPSGKEIDEALCEIPTDIPWRLVDYNRARRVFANRLARFTAPKDAAEDVLFDLEVKGTRGDGSVTHFKLCGSSIRQIVAAVRAADRKAGR